MLDKDALRGLIARLAADTFEVWNGAIAGERFSTFTQAKIDTMFPASRPIDVVILGGGHNNTTQAPGAFITAGIMEGAHP